MLMASGQRLLVQNQTQLNFSCGVTLGKWLQANGLSATPTFSHLSLLKKYHHIFEWVSVKINLRSELDKQTTSVCFLS